jgi:hypothetical protein
MEDFTTSKYGDERSFCNGCINVCSWCHETYPTTMRDDHDDCIPEGHTQRYRPMSDMEDSEDGEDTSGDSAVWRWEYAFQRHWEKHHQFSTEDFATFVRARRPKVGSLGRKQT